MNFRVRKTTTNDFISDPGKRVTTTTVWEGTDVVALSEAYPPSNVVGADALGYCSIEDGWISWYHHFEQLVNGQWVACNDPRIRIDRCPSELEVAIEEENRRLFPGDYIDHEEDDGDYDDNNYYYY